MSSSDSKDFLQELKEQAKSSVSDGSDDQERPKTRVDPSDGTVYEWDGEKRGWFPKVSLLKDLVII